MLNTDAQGHAVAIIVPYVAGKIRCGQDVCCDTGLLSGCGSTCGQGKLSPAVTLLSFLCGERAGRGTAGYLSEIYTEKLKRKCCMRLIYACAGRGVLVQAEIGIIGGSGLYSMPGFTNVREVKLETPFGDPS